MAVTDAHFKADLDAIAKALRELEQATKQCSIADISTLHSSGYLPTGIMAYLSAVKNIDK